MPIALASKNLGAHWIQCANCDGWFNPSYDAPVTVPDGWDEKVVCTNCADKLDFAACYGCAKSCKTDGMIGINGTWYCDDCATQAGMSPCSDCDEWVDVDDMVDCSGTHYCEDCARHKGWDTCAECDEWLNPDAQYASPSGAAHCEECFHITCSLCDGCGEVGYNHDMHAAGNGFYCDSCETEVDDFEPGGFRNRSGRTTELGSERCFGLELETEDCDNYHCLEDLTAWGAKNDSTVNGKEFYSDILDGDEGLKAIADLAEVAEQNNWQVDEDCGYHLHIDMRRENDDSLKAAAFAYRATAEVWHSFVDSGRHNNGYSHKARWNCNDLAGYSGSFQQFVYDTISSRYEWLNLQAYARFSTFEVRLHHGSLDEKEICNWVKAHARFTDWATTLGFEAVKEKLSGKLIREKFDIIANEAWNDTTLRDYYAAKIVTT